MKNLYILNGKENKVTKCERLYSCFMLTCVFFIYLIFIFVYAYVHTKLKYLNENLEFLHDQKILS